MQLDLRTVSIKPLRQAFGHIARRIGHGKSASRYQEGTLDLQPTAQQHYRPLWGPEYNYFDKQRTAIVMADWYVFKDPRQYYYGSYVIARSRQQDAAENSFGFVESRGLVQLMPAEMTALALDLLLPLRHVAWGASMNNDFAAAYGYGTAITQPALYAAMDQFGIAQFITRAGLLLSGPESLDVAKVAWMESPMWQSLRRVVEDLFVEKDWFEVLLAQNLVLDGLLFSLVYRTIIDDVMASQGGSAVAMLTQFQAEWSTESAKWIDAQIKIAAAASEENTQLIRGWTDKWKARIIPALLPLAERALGDRADETLQEVAEGLDARLAKVMPK